MKRMTLLLVLVLTATLGFAQQDWENATKITSGATVQSAFGKEGDITSHWYCIDVPEEGSITLTTRSETTLRLGIADVQALHDDGRIYSRGSQDMDSYNADADVVFNLDGLAFGTYYIQLKHYAGAGAYSLHYRFTPCATVADPEPNNDFENAAPMEIDVVQNGRLGYSYFAVADTKDWYRIELPEEGDLEMAVHSDPQLQLGRMYIYGLFHGETKEIDSFDFDNYGKDTTLVHTFAGLSASTFYIQQMH